MKKTVTEVHTTKNFILFDLDGTLIDSLPLIRQTYEHVFKEMNLPWEEEKFMETVGLPLIEACRRFGGERQQEMWVNTLFCAKVLLVCNLKQKPVGAKADQQVLRANYRS